jgi:hypothetical protein
MEYICDHQLSVYVFIFNKISLLFHPIFLNLTCAYPYLYNLMLTASYVYTIMNGVYMWSELFQSCSSCPKICRRLTWIILRPLSALSLDEDQNNDIVMGIILIYDIINFLFTYLFSIKFLIQNYNCLNWKQVWNRNWLFPQKIHYFHLELFK